MLKIAQQENNSAEIFYSIQGEGINTGQPAVFLRLALCNLACTWCDTKYTWDGKQNDIDRRIIAMPPIQVEEEIQKHKCHFLVITGGEPLIQQDELLPLLNDLKKQPYYFEIETNGTLIPKSDIVKLIDHWNVSPKLANSGNHVSAREKADCYAFFNKLPNSHFKFVIDNENDFSELNNIVQKYNIKPEKIILMPQATDGEILLQKSRWLVELCKSEGYIFSVRLQILLWGNKRGI